MLFPYVSFTTDRFWRHGTHQATLLMGIPLPDEVFSKSRLGNELFYGVSYILEVEQRTFQVSGHDVVASIR